MGTAGNPGCGRMGFLGGCGEKYKVMDFSKLLGSLDFFDTNQSLRETSPELSLVGRSVARWSNSVIHGPYNIIYLYITFFL